MSVNNKLKRYYREGNKLTNHKGIYKRPTRNIAGEERNAIIEYLADRGLGYDDLREWLNGMGISKSDRTLDRLIAESKGFPGMDETQRYNLATGRRATQLKQNEDGSVEGFQISIERPYIILCEVCGHHPPEAADEYRVEKDAIEALKKHWEFHEGIDQ